MDKIKGFTAGAFDLLHAGHYMMFKEAAEQCDHLTVFLQTDPSIDRPEKNKPIESVEERMIKLEACRYIDDIIIYETEADLHKLASEYGWNLRIVGADHKGKKFTGDELPIKVYFNSRDHQFSTTDLRRRVYEAEKNKRN